MWQHYGPLSNDGNIKVSKLCQGKKWGWLKAHNTPLLIQNSELIGNELFTKSPPFVFLIHFLLEKKSFRRKNFFHYIRT